MKNNNEIRIVVNGDVRRQISGYLGEDKMKLTEDLMDIIFFGKIDIEDESYYEKAMQGIKKVVDQWNYDIEK